MKYFTKYVCFYALDDKNTLLLNTLTSAMDVLDNCSFEKIKKWHEKGSVMCVDENDIALCDKLKRRGYIFDSKEKELELVNSMAHINKKITSSASNVEFTICPTMGCNLRCVYCFENSDKHKDYNVMSGEQLDTIFGYISKRCDEIEMENQKRELEKKAPIRPKILLFGGEPLLNNTYFAVEKILDFSEKCHIPVMIVTNGTTIDEKYSSLLKKHKNALAVQITLDGNKTVNDSRRIRSDGTGTFESICKGIQKILDLQIRLSLRINVDNDNMSTLSDLRDIFEKFGWLQNPLFVPYISPVQCFGKDDPSKVSRILDESKILDIALEKGWYGQDKSFLNAIVSPTIGLVTRFFDSSNSEVKPWKKSYCEGTFGSNYCFTPNGVISTCLTCVGNPKHSIGTFDENGVKIDGNKLKIWKNRSPFKIEKCKECKFSLFCGGGCPVYCLENYGDINCGTCTDIERTLEVYVKHNKNKFLKLKKNT